MAGDVVKSVEQKDFSWDFFRDLPDERNAFYQAAHVRRAERKEILLFEGESSDSVFYLKEGQAISTRVSTDGKEFVLYIYSKGALIGSMAALVNLPRYTTVQLLTRGMVYELHNRDFRKLIAKYPALIERIVFELYAGLDFMSAQYMSAFSDDAEIRLKRLLATLFSGELLKSQPDSQPNSISLDITQDQLACAIGVTRAMISRVLQRMKREGLISISEHKISFLKPEHFISYLELVPARTSLATTSKPVSFIKHEPV